MSTVKAARSLAMLLIAAGAARAQTPTVSPVTLSFTYQVGTDIVIDKNPASQTIKVTLPSSAPSTATVSAVVKPVTTGLPFPGWLTVTPSGGHAPLTLTVRANPTSLVPGSYSGLIVVTSSGGQTATVSANLLVSNPPPGLLVSSPDPPPYYNPPLSGSTPTLTFSFTTGDLAATPDSVEVDVKSTTGTVPFDVTTANVSGATKAGWLRVANAAGTGQPSTGTSGVANTGSWVPLNVSVDFATLSSLDIGPYTGTVTVTPSSTTSNGKATGAITLNVNLMVSAGPPSLDATVPIFPTSVVAGLAIDPVITIYGDNFFNNTSVVMTPQNGAPLPAFTPKYLSRQVLQVTIPHAYFAAPGSWTLTVMNSNLGSGPQQASTSFLVTSATAPVISSVVNAASYLKTTPQTGSVSPVPTGGSSVSPREIISIFGQNLGPVDIYSADVLPGPPQTYPAQVTPPAGSTISAYLLIGTRKVYMPVIMVSSNQINAIVPVGVSPVLGTAGPNANVVVDNGGTLTPNFPVTVVAEDPGVFTLGGLGQGPAAVLNYDSTKGYTVNSSKNPAPRGSVISIYATGLGDLLGSVTITATDSSTPPQTATRTLPLAVDSLNIQPGALPVGSLNAAYSTAMPVVFTATGGTAPYTWEAKNLPAGMALDASTGQLSGAPTAAGAVEIVVTATDSSPSPLSSWRKYWLAIDPALAITTPVLPDGVAGASYSPVTPVLMAAQGGNSTSYFWSATGLPLGLGINSTTGAIAGMPIQKGTWDPVTISVFDSSTGLTAQRTYAITISAGLAITTASLPSALLNTTYSPAATTLQVQGGTAPIVWSASPNRGLPPGIDLDTSGILSGSPAQTIPFLPDGAVAPGAVSVANNTYRVDIDGQPCVVAYVGASYGSVAGLVQINAIVPPNAHTGASIPLTVSIGGASAMRTSQAGATIAVK